MSCPLVNQMPLALHVMMRVLPSNITVQISKKLDYAKGVMINILQERWSIIGRNTSMKRNVERAGNIIQIIGNMCLFIKKIDVNSKNT